MSNLNRYYAEDCRFDSVFGWLRSTQHCACNKWLPTFRYLQSSVNLQSYSNLQSQNWTESYGNLQPQNWTESCEEVQKKIINSNPNLFKQKWEYPNPSIFWNVAGFKSKCMFISGHFYVLRMLKPHFQCNNNPSFLQWTAHIARSFCECCTCHHLHILVKVPLCCDWKGRAASTLSFVPWHQATRKIPRRAHLISACSRHMGAVLHAHLVRG